MAVANPLMHDIGGFPPPNMERNDWLRLQRTIGNPHLGQQFFQPGGQAFHGMAGAQVGMQFGLDPSFGPLTAGKAANFGEAFKHGAGQQGFGGLSNAQARALDQELRLAAALSPMANMMGAAMAMSEAGLLQGKTMTVMGANGRPQNIDLGNLSDKDKNKRQETLRMLSQAGPAGFVDAMARSGVDPATTAQFLGARQANQEQIAKNNIQDDVRRMQGMEVAGIIQQNMLGGIVGGLRATGMGMQERRMLAPVLAQTMQQTLTTMDEKTRNDPQARNTAITEALRKQPGMAGMPQEALKQMVAGSMRGLEESVRADPDLRKHGNLAGLLAMHGGLVDDAEKVEKKEAEKPPDKPVEKKDAAPPPKDGDKKPAGQAGGQGVMRIDIATLIIRADGSAELNADNIGGVPANP